MAVSRSTTLRSSCTTLPKNSSVSRMNACRNVSSKVGNASRSGALFSRFRSASHWSGKFFVNAFERSSASIRRTCASSTPGARSRFRLARFSSSSSGMLLHRKNDRREASSVSAMRYGVPAATVNGSRSGRNTNEGLARIRRSANSTPALKDAPVRPVS